MNVVDSSGWLEVFADGPNAAHFLPPLKDVASLVVPAISIYEVFKVVFKQRGETPALEAVAAMQRGSVADVTGKLALAASRISLEHGLPMADSLILATAQQYDAVVWTQDADFRGMTGVKYFPGRKR